VIFTAASVRI